MAELPTGTVTFFFTDIEGSTRLVQELGESWTSVVERHAELIRAAVAAHGGSEVRTEGDAFFVAFPTATGAVAAAAAAQRALAAEPWPDGRAVRVRIGLHSGLGVRGGDDYVGLDVHRAARIAAVGHGGQVLVSGATRELVGDRPGEGLQLRDLGSHRLKDLSRSERIHQLDIQGLRTDFPVLLSLEGHANNLPVQLTSFLGREGDVHAVVELVRTERLVTLTGPGGTGKTRLAQQVAAELLPELDDGAFFIDLAPLGEPDLVVEAINTALGLTESNEDKPFETLASWLADRRMLLVLDNFEHLLGAAPAVANLLARSAGLRVLVTSRGTLDLNGEREFVVPPLGLTESVALFVERARLVNPAFAVTNESAPAVAEIASRLDGLPLAIELAAGRAKLLSPQAMLARLEGRLDFLGAGKRDLPARQQTLRAAIQWSWDLLDEAEQALLRRLSVFNGGWTMDAVEHVCDPTNLGLDALAALTTLVGQSLVRQEEAEHGEPRLRLLETIREFAAEQLAASGEADDLGRRHARHFLEVAEHAEPELTTSPEVVDQLGHDHDNLRAALAWTIEAGDAEVGLRLAHALWRFWHLRGHLREGREWFDRLLALPAAADPTRHRALGLTGAAGIAYWQNDYAAAEAWYLESEQIFRDLGDDIGLADALFNTASMAMIRGDMGGARDMMAEGRKISESIGDRELVAKFLEAEGYAAFLADDFEAARPLLERVKQMADEGDSKLQKGLGFHMLAQVDRLEGKLEDAITGYRQSIAIAREMGLFSGMIEPLQGLAATLVVAGNPERGVRILGGVDAIRERAGGGPPPEWIRLGDPLGDAAGLIGQDAVDEAFAEGRALDDDEVAALATD